MTTQPPVDAPEAEGPATLLANASWMVAARAVGLVLTGSLTIYAVRTLAVEDYGHYSLAIALVTICGLLSELGISALALREMSTEPERAQRILNIALVAELVTSGVACVVMIPAALALGYPGAVLVLLAFGSGIVVLQGGLAALDAAFKARRLMRYVAGALIAQTVVTAAAGFTLLLLGAGAPGLMAALLLGNLAGVGLLFVYSGRVLGLTAKLQANRRDVLRFLRGGTMIALTGVVGILYERLDVLMLSKLDSVEGVAVYSVPFQIIQYGLLVPAIVGTAFFPLLAENLKHDPLGARDQYLLMVRLYLFISVPGAILLSVGAEPLLTFVYGDRYAASAEPMRFFGAVLVLGFLNLLFWYGILAVYRERTMAAISLVGLGLNALLGVILIPDLGPRGAAIALVASYVVIVVWQAALLRRHLFPIPAGAMLAKPLVAGAAAAAVTVPLYQASELGAACAGAATFLVALLALRYISKEEWQPLTVPVRALLGRS